MNNNIVTHDFSNRLNYSYLTGVYLAINAISGAFLLMDGPTCCFHKAEHIFGRHDLYSDLLDCSGLHRIQFSGTDTKKITTDYERELKQMIFKLLSLDSCKMLFISSIPFCTLAGIDYARLNKEAAYGFKKIVAEIPGRSLEEDWLQGYAEVMSVLAKRIDLTGSKPKKNNVAIVGYFMDRHEGDHEGNILELKRIFKALGLDMVSLWFSGVGVDELKNIKNASVIYAFPYGLQAARILGKRLNIPVLEVPLPFGIEKTKIFINKVSNGSKIECLAENFIQQEMKVVARRLEWVVPYLFLNKNFIWMGDPYLGECFLSLMKDFGALVDVGVITSKQSHGEQLKQTVLKSKLRLLFEPRRREWQNEFSKEHLHKTDLVVGDTSCLSLLPQQCAKVEFGFPSYFYHVIHDEPFLGFKGTLSFVHRLSNELLKRTGSH